MVTSMTSWSHCPEPPVWRGGTTHSFQVRSDRCRFFVITTPGAHAFFADAERTVGDNSEDLDTLIAVAKRNSLSSPLF
jgi:hypothetical protein